MMRRFAFVVMLLTVFASAASADTLSGRVRDRYDRAVSGVAVRVMSGQQVVAVAITDASGFYGPIQLPAGRLEVEVSTPGLRVLPRTITAGSGTAEIRLDLTVDEVQVAEYVVVPGYYGDYVGSRVTDRGSFFERREVQVLQTDTLAALLRVTPGFHVASAGGAGAFASMFLRGGNPDHVLVVVDGVAQNTFGGSFDAASFGTLSIDRIDVLAGSTSVVDGIRAPSGIVRIESRGEGAAQTDASVEMGSGRSARATLELTRGRGNWHLNSAAEWLRSEGRNGTKLASGTSAVNDEYSRSAARASAIWRKDGEGSVRFDIRGALGDRGYPGPWGWKPADGPPVLDMVSRGRDYSLQSGISGFAATEAVRQRASVTFAARRNTFDNPLHGASVDTIRATAHYHAETEINPSLEFSSGIDAEFERVHDSLIATESGRTVPVSRLFAGWFVEGRQSVAGRLFLSAGLRYDYLRRYDIAGNTAMSAFRPDLREEAVGTANPQGALTWLIRPNGSTRLHADAGRAMKSPAALEFGMSEQLKLRPERTGSASVGLSQTLLSQRLAVDADLFATRFHDLILPVAVQRDEVRRLVTENIEEARAMGATVSTTLRLAPALVARVSATRLATKVLEVRAPQAGASNSLPIRVGDALLRRPKWSYAGSLTLSRGRGSAFITVNGRGVMPEADPLEAAAIFANPGFISIAVGGEAAVGARVRIFARATNLLGRRYEEVLGYPAQGRVITAGLRFTTAR